MNTKPPVDVKEESEPVKEDFINKLKADVMAAFSGSDKPTRDIHEKSATSGAARSRDRKRKAHLKKQKVNRKKGKKS